MNRIEKQREYGRLRQEKIIPAYEALMKNYPLSAEDITGEIWLPVRDYDLYHVSNYSRVKSFKYRKPRILKPVLQNGYLCVRLYLSGKQKSIGVHVLVARAFIPNPDNKPEVNHDDGHPMNCTVGNLSWMTHAENIQHSYDTGLQIPSQGTACYNAKLNADQIKYIRSNPDDLTTYQLAAKFNTTHGIISSIQRGKSYKNVGGSLRGNLQGGLPRVPDTLRNQIRDEYVKGSRQFGTVALGKKYGFNHATIWNIVHELR